MAHFLCENRRRTLIEQLTELTMPQEMAELFASFEDDLLELDILLAAQVKSLEQWMKEGNSDFIQASGLILTAYITECMERDIPTTDLPIYRRKMDELKENSGYNASRTLQ